MGRGQGRGESLGVDGGAAGAARFGHFDLRDVGAGRGATAESSVGRGEFRILYGERRPPGLRNGGRIEVEVNGAESTLRAKAEGHRSGLRAIQRDAEERASTFFSESWREGETKSEFPFLIVMLRCSRVRRIFALLSRIDVKAQRKAREKSQPRNLNPSWIELERCRAVRGDLKSVSVDDGNNRGEFRPAKAISSIRQRILDSTFPTPALHLQALQTLITAAAT